MHTDRFWMGNYPDSAEGLTQEIRKIIDKNQVDGSELFMTDCDDDIYHMALIAEWTFYGSSHKTIKAGQHKASIHFGYDYDEFDKHHHNLMSEAQYGERLRTPFIQQLISLDGNAPLEYHTKHTFHYYEPFSTTHDCDTCHATGKITCTDCKGKGKKTCWGCGGSGDESYQVPIYDNKNAIRGYQTRYRSCSACLGSGKTTCSTCKGDGKLICEECSGHGLFTHIYDISAVAEPDYGVYIDDSYHLSALQRFLNEQGASFCAHKIRLTLAEYHNIEYQNTEYHDTEYQNADSDTFELIYEGSDTHRRLFLALRERTYECHAFSSPPYPYIRPAIFDDLFDNEWQFLQNSFDKHNKLKKEQALLFFYKYMNQPALDTALKSIANKHPAQMALTHACAGFISHQMADNIGTALAQILNTLSPRYSKAAWIVFGIPAVFITFMIAQYRFWQSRGFIEMVVALFAGVFYSLVFTLMIGAIALIISRLYAYVINQKIPQEYRLSPSNETAIDRYLQAAMLAFVIGAVYGLLAKNGYAPTISPKYYLQGVSFLGNLKELVLR